MSEQLLGEELAALRRRLYVALVEQRVVDSQKYGEAPYAPITWEDVDRDLAQRPGAIDALAELIRLKDGPRDDAYRRDKDAAWDAARAALAPSPVDHHQPAARAAEEER